MYQQKNRWIVTLFLIVSLLFFNRPAFAQAPSAGLNLTLSPTTFNFSTNPGEKISSQLRIRNNNDFTENFKIGLGKYKVTSQTQQADLQQVDPGDPFAQWIKFDTNAFSIGPNQVKIIKFTITPPKSAALGYYYAIVINRAEEQVGEARNTTSVQGAAAASIILDVLSPNAQKNLQVVDFSTEHLFNEYLPVNFRTTVRNTGNIHLRPAGDIFIDGIGEKQIADIHFNTGVGNVLPQTQRTFANSWTDGFIVRSEKVDETGATVRDKNGNTVYTAKWDFTKADKFRIGKYTAHLLMIYDSGERDIPVEATVSFWVIPWKIILASLVILYLVFLGVRDRVASLSRKLKKKK